MSEVGMEELAIIKGPSFGLRDAGRPILWFGVEFLGGGALMVYEGSHALRFVEEHGVRDIRDLDGKPCVITSSGPGSVVRFVRLFK